MKPPRNSTPIQGLYQLEGLEPRILLSGDALGTGIPPAAEIVWIDPAQQGSLEESPVLTSGETLPAELFPALEVEPLEDEATPMDEDDVFLSEFAGAAEGLANGLDAFADWADSLGNQRIPGMENINISAPNLSQPDLTRSINFMQAPMLPGGMYQLSIDGALFNVTMTEGMTKYDLPILFADLINEGGEFVAQASGSMLRLLPGDPALGTQGAGDLDILLSSWRDWGILNQTLPLINPTAYLTGENALPGIPEMGYGSLTEMMDFGGVVRTHLTEPLSAFLRANPGASLAQIEAEIRSLGAQLPDLDLDIDLDGILAERLQNLSENIDELRFVIPVQYIRGPPDYSLDLGSYADMLGLALSELEEISLPFDVTVAFDLVFGYDLRLEQELEPFFLEFVDGITAQVDAAIEDLEAYMRVGVLGTEIALGQIELQFEVLLDWADGILEQGRMTLESLEAAVGNFVDALDVEDLLSRWEALLPLVVDFPGVLLPEQLPQILILAEDFLRSLPDVTLVDFERLEDFLGLTPQVLLQKLQELGDVLRGVVDLDAFRDLILPFTQDLDFSQWMDLPEIYINRFLEQFKVDEAWVFGDLQTFIAQMQDFLVEGEIVKGFDLSFAPEDRELVLELVLETGVSIGNTLFGFAYGMGPIQIQMSNSSFAVEGRAGLAIELTIDLEAPVVGVRAEAGLTLPSTGILPGSALIEILLENGAVTDGGIVAINVEADPGNLSLEDLLLDVNAALAASFFGGLIQARIEEGRFVFENTYTGASPEFMIRAPELLGHAEFERAAEPPGGRVTLQRLEAYAHASIQAQGLQAAARLGFLDIVSGGGELSLCLDGTVNLTPNGPVVLADFHEGVFTQPDQVEMETDLRINEGGSCQGLILRGITVSGGFAANPPDLAEIRIRFAEGFSFPGDLPNPDKYIIEYIGDFSDIFHFGEMDLDLMIQFLIELADAIDSHLDLNIFNRKIPLLDLSLREILSFSDILGELALRVQAMGVESIQAFFQVVNDELRDILQPLLAYQGVELDLTLGGVLVGTVFNWEIFFEGAIAKQSTLRASVGGDLGTVVDLRADSELEIVVHALADLRMAVDFSDPMAPAFLLRQGTELRMDFLLDATVEFVAAVGPIGVFVGPGYLRIYDGLPGTPRGPAHAHLILNAGPGGSVALDQAATAFSVDILGELDASLPLYFPQPQHLGDLTLNFTFTAFNLNGFVVTYGVPEIDFDTLDFFGGLGDGIDLFFLALEMLLQERFGLARLPYIGAQLRDIAVFLVDIRGGITDAFRAATQADATHIRNLLEDVFGVSGLDWLTGAVNVVVQKTGDTLDSLEVLLPLGGTHTFASGAWDFDLGLPLLEFELDAALDVTLSWDWMLQFAVTRTEGFTLIADEAADELNLSLNVTLAPGSAMSGTLGILYLGAEVNTQPGVPASALSVQLAVNFQPLSGNRVSLNRLLSGEGVEIHLDGSANLHLILQLGFAASGGGAIDSLPSFAMDFSLVWNFLAASLDDGVLGEAPEIRFDNLRLDLGSFINQFLRPIVEQVNEYLAPLRPVIDILDTNIKALNWGPLQDVFDVNNDNRVTLLDLAQRFGQVSSGTAAFVEAVAAVMRLADTLLGATPQGESPMDGEKMWIPLDLGSSGFSLFGGAGVDVRTMDPRLAPIAWEGLFPEHDWEDLFGQHGEDGLYRETRAAQFEFLLLDPANIIKLLLGHELEFFRFSPPAISLEFRFTKSFPIWPTPKVSLILTAGVGMKAEITFGYDSSGIRAFLESGDPADVFGGFYVVAGRKNPLITLWGEIGGGASVSYGIGVSAVAVVRLEARFSLFDPGQGKIYLSAIRPLIELKGLSQVVDCLFEIQMEVTARVTIRVYLDLEFTTVTLFRIKLGPFTLLGPYTKAGGGCLLSQIPDRFEALPEEGGNNNTFERASDLGYAPGVHLRGVSLSHMMDQDWYSFEMPKDDAMLVELRGEPGMVMQLFDADENLLAFTRPGTSELLRMQTGTLEAGRYFLQIYDPNSRVIAPYELDLLPGTGSNTRLFYVAGVQSAQPEVHSFYTLAAGNAADNDAGRSPDRPAASLAHLLALHTPLPGDFVLVDSGVYAENLILMAQHVGFYILGTSRQRYEGLPETTVFGTWMDPQNSSLPTIVFQGTDGITLRGFGFEGGTVAIRLDQARNTNLTQLTFASMDTGIEDVGQSENTRVGSSHWTEVGTGVDMPEAEGLWLSHLTFQGTGTETAIRIGGDDLHLLDISMVEHLNGLVAQTFGSLFLENLRAEDTDFVFVFTNGTRVEATDLQSTGGIVLVDSDGVDALDIDGFISDRHQNGLVVEAGETLTLRHADFGERTPLTIAMGGEVILEEVIGLRTLKLQAARTQLTGVHVAPLEMPESWQKETSVLVTTEGDATLTSSEFHCKITGAVAGHFLAVDSSMEGLWLDESASIHFQGSFLGEQAGRFYSSGNISFTANSQVETGFVYVNTSGSLLLDELLYHGQGFSGEIGGNLTVTRSRLSLTPAATQQGNAPPPPRGILLDMQGGQALIENNPSLGISLILDQPSDVILRNNPNMFVFATITQGASLLMENNAGSSSMTATLSGQAWVRENHVLTHLQISALGNVEVSDNTLGVTETKIPTDSVASLSAPVITVQDNIVQGGRFNVSASSVLLFQRNDLEGLGLSLAASGTAEVVDNVFLGRSKFVGVRVKPDQPLLALAAGELQMHRNQITDVNAQVLYVLQGDLFENTFVNAGLEATNSSDLAVYENSFSDGAFGLLIDGTHNSVFHDNTVSDTDYGVILRGSEVRRSEGIVIRDNLIQNGGWTGIHVENAHMVNLVVQDNQILGYDGNGLWTKGPGVFQRNEISGSLTGARVDTLLARLYENDIHGNTVGMTGIGFLGNDDRGALRHNVIHDNQTGVLAQSGAVVAFNRVYNNGTGIRAEGSGIVLRHNLVYRNSGASILVQGGNGVSVFNNTVYSPAGTYGVRVQGAAQNVNLRNNIVWSQSGVAVSVTFDSDLGLQSDYNTWFTSGTATLGEWSRLYDDLYDWQIFTRQDLNSLGTTRVHPLRDQPQFADLGADDYRILSSLAPSVNSGDPAFSFGNEPGPNGGPNGLRINQGAYGDTALAALSPESYIRLLAPAYHLDWLSDSVRRILWESFNLTGNVTLELHESTAGKLLDITTQPLNHKPAQVPEQPASQGSFFWSPNLNDILGDNSKSYRIRVVSGARQSENREVFLVPEVSTDYYLDPLGDNRLPGTSPATAKAVIFALVESIPLTGRTVHFAAGEYIHPRDVLISSDPDLGGNEAFELLGPDSGTALLNRAVPLAGRTGLILDNASHMILKDLHFVNAGTGLDIRNGSQWARLENLVVTGHVETQIRIRGNSIRATLEGLTVEDGLSHGIEIEGRLELLANSVISGHPGLGLRLTDTGDGRVEGNRIENNAGGGLWLNNRTASTQTRIGHEDLSLGKGNVFAHNGGTQVQVAGGALVAGNSVFRTDKTGRGILSDGQPVRFNVVSGHSTGIEMTKSGLIEGNRIFNIGSAAIRLYGSANTTVSHNVIYSTGYGIYNEGSSSTVNVVYRNNLIYAASESAIHQIRGRNILVENNTFRRAGGSANILTFLEASDITLRNNIFSLDKNLAVSLDVPSQVGFSSDYNLYDLRGTANLGTWNGTVRNTLAAWRAASFHDAWSLSADPLFVDPDGADGVLGYLNAASDGRDDLFHLQSHAGSFAYGSTAPVRDLATDRAVWPLPVLTVDSGHSPAIDRGHPSSAFANEPASNGGFVNLGAFGNTALASLSPAQYVMLLSPNGGEVRPRGQTHNIVWRSHDASGTVDIELWREGAMTPESVLGSAVSNSGSFAWTVSGSLTLAADYRIHVRRSDASAVGVSLGSFSVTEAIQVYYVNNNTVIADGYTSAVGDSANDGLDPSRPKDSIRGVIESYSLKPGDTILVDEGTYTLTANILLGLAQSGVTIRGFYDPARPTLGTVLDRGNRTAGYQIFVLQGAVGVTLEHLTLRGAHRAIYGATGGSTDLTVRNSVLQFNGNAGIYLEGAHSGLRVEDNLFQGTGSNESLGAQSNGVYFNGPSALIQNNRFEANYQYGIHVYANAALDAVDVLNNEVVDGYNGIRVDHVSSVVSGRMRVEGNVIIGKGTTGTGLALDGKLVLATDNEVRSFSTGISAQNGVRVIDNPLITGNVTGLTVQSGSVAIGNSVFGNTDGIVATGSGARVRVEDNHMYNNTQYGVRINNGTLRGNRIQGGGTGIYAENPGNGSLLEISNNQVFANLNHALLSTGGHVAARVIVTQNLFAQSVGNTLRLQAIGTQELVNNILIADQGRAVELSAAALPGFRSDYNLYTLRNGGSLFLWDGQSLVSLRESFLSAGQDAHSKLGEPLFVDESAADFRLLPGSPALDAGDPRAAWLWEGADHGGRADIGPFGNSPDATETESTALQILDPHGLSLWRAGREGTLRFLAPGFGEGQSAAAFNAGTTHAVDWNMLTPGTGVFSYPLQAASVVDLSGVSDPAPEWVYREYHSFSSRADYALSLPEGNYRLRLHFLSPHVASTQSMRIELDGVVLHANFNITNSAGGALTAVIEEFDVTVGEAGLSTLLSLIAVSGTGYFSGYEIVRLHDPAPDALFDVEVTLDGGLNWNVLAQDVSVNQWGIGELSWNPSAASSGAGARFRVISTALPSLSAESAFFAVAPAGNVYYVNDLSQSGDVYTHAVGSAANSGVSPDSPLPSIQAVLNAYTPGAGDVIWVDTGSYSLSANLRLDARHSGLTIRGAYDENNPSARSVLDRNQRGTQSAYVFELVGVDGLTLENLTLQNAYRGIHVIEGGGPNLTLRDNRFLTNGLAGLWVLANNPGLWVEGNYFEGANTFVESAGAQRYAMNLANAEGDILDNVLLNNWDYGIWMDPGSNKGLNYRVEGNTITGSGQGIRVDNFQTGGALLRDNSITGKGGSSVGIYMVTVGVIAEGNTVTGANIGIHALEKATVRDNLQVYGNTTGIRLESGAVATGNTVYGNTDGIVSTSTALLNRIEGNVIRNNSRYGVQADRVELIDNRIHENQSGVYLSQQGSSPYVSRIVNNTIHGNTQHAIWVNNSQVRAHIHQNTLAQSGSGNAAVRVDAANAVWLANNILATDSAAAVRAAAAAQSGFQSDYNLYHLLNAAPVFQWADFVYLSRVDLYFATGFDAHSLFTDPLFVNAPSGDYRVLPGSPVLNAGDPALPWIGEGQGDGGRADIGAQGNGADALQGADPTLQILDPTFLAKWVQGLPGELVFLASGFGIGQTASWHNAGPDTFGGWSSLALPLNASTSTIALSNLLNLSQVIDPAPEDVYRQFHSIYQPAAYDLDLSPGLYRLRLHFINTYSWQASYSFHVEVDGVRLLENVTILNPDGANYRASLIEVDVEVGPEGLSEGLKFVPVSGTASFAGFEVMRRSVDAPDAGFAVDVSVDGGQTFVEIATGVGVDSRGIGRLNWTPAAPTAGTQALLRVRSLALPGLSAQTAAFSVANDGPLYYVNDAGQTRDVYSSAPGNNLNTGKSPDQPMASLEALLTAYSLGEGDIVYIDTGAYALSRNLLLTAAQSGLTIRGAHDPENPAALTVLNRGARVDTAFVFELQGVQNLTLAHLQITGAHTGIQVGAASSLGEGASGLLLDHLRVFDNTFFGIRILQNNGSVLLRDSQVTGSGGASDLTRQNTGLYSLSTEVLIENSHFQGNYATGIELRASTQPAIGYRIDNSRIEQSGTGIYAVVKGLLVENSEIVTHRDYGVRMDSDNALVTLRDNDISGNGFGNSLGAGVYSDIFGPTNIHVIEGNRIHGNRIGLRMVNMGIVRGNDIAFNEFGMTWNASRSDKGGVVEGNRIYANIQMGIRIDWNLLTVRNNQIYSNPIGISKTDNNFAYAGLIENNLFYDHSVAALQVAKGSDTFRVAHNTFYESSVSALVLLNTAAARVVNNIFHVDAGFAIQADAASVGKVTSNHNLFFNTGTPAAFIGEWGGVLHQTLAAWQAASLQDANSLYADPLFYDRNGADDVLGYRNVDGFWINGGVDDNFHLQRNSPAIGLADPAWVPAADMEGVSRSASSDAGAYTFRGSPLDETPPQVLLTLPAEVNAGGTAHAFVDRIALLFSEAMDSIDALSLHTFQILRDVDGNGIFDSMDEEIPFSLLLSPDGTRIDIVFEDDLHSGHYRFRARAANLRDLAGNQLSGGNYTRDFDVAVPPAVIEEIVINGGAVQRSRVTQITVRFDRDLLPESAPDTIRVLNRNSGTAMQTTMTWDASAHSVTLTFPAHPGGSLPDGLYTLVIDGDSVTGRGLDANGDGEAGGIHTLDFHRLFGDSSGSGFVSNLDVLRFRRALDRSAGQSGYDPAFDADVSGTVTSADRDALISRVAVALDPASAPPLVLRAPATVVAAPGDSVTFRVYVHAPVPVTFVWSFDGAELARGPGLFELQLANLSLPDFGNYSVLLLSETGDLPPLLLTLELAE